MIYALNDRKKVGEAPKLELCLFAGNNKLADSVCIPYNLWSGERIQFAVIGN